MRPVVSARIQAVILAVILVAGIVGWYLSPEFVFRLVNANTGVGGISLYALLVCCYLVRPFLLWPVSILSVTVGFLFGSTLGVVVALGGTVLTCLPPYLLAQSFQQADWNYLSQLMESGEQTVAAIGGVRGMTAARLSPAPADVVSYGAGLSNVSLGAFVVGTLLGEIPWAIFFVTVGDSLNRLSTGGVPAVNLELLLAALVAAALLVARPLYETVWLD